jgi:hypothetical protein
MWGPSIIGFGTHHYVYESGREGDICLAGFSPRKGNTVIYGMNALGDGVDAHLKKLGKHKASKGCLYIKKLADVDIAVLRQLIERSVKQHTSKPKKK